MKKLVSILVSIAVGNMRSRYFLILLVIASIAEAFSGAGAGTEEDPYIITNVYQLQEMNNDLDAWYELGNDIDASGTSSWNGGAGFEPIGNITNKFKGHFESKGHIINGLYINRNSTNYVGLFGYTDIGSEIKNASLVNVDIAGSDSVGSLVGANKGTISNSYSTGAIRNKSPYWCVGGLVGSNSGNIDKSYSTGSVSGYYIVGGLTGSNSGTITDSYSTGSVSGYVNVGGLVGSNYGNIYKSYSTKSVSGAYAGGLVGWNEGNINMSYAKGNVGTLSECIGGLVGWHEGSISNSYSTGNVNGWSGVGGLVAYICYGTIINSYSTGYVSGSIDVGGLVGGKEYGSCNSCFWDKNTSGRSTSACGTGKTTAEMKQRSTFTSWDFVNIWGIIENETYPFLRGTPEEPNEPSAMIVTLGSTEKITSQIKSGFGKLPVHLEQGFPGPIPNKDSPAGNYIETSGGLESIEQTGNLPGRYVPVLSQMSFLGRGQPISMDLVSLVPYFGIFYDWLTKPRGMQDEPSPEDLRQRLLLTDVNGMVRVNEFTGNNDVNLSVRFQVFGAARGYALGTIQTTIEHAIMQYVMLACGTQLSLFEKIMYKISQTCIEEYIGQYDAVGFDSRFRAILDACIYFGDPVNMRFYCPIIVPDGSSSYLWLGGGMGEINSGLVWRSVDFQVTIPTNQDIPLLFQFMTSAETAGLAYGGAGIERYKLEFTCSEIPELGTHVIDSYDYRSLTLQKTAAVTTVVPAAIPPAITNRSSSLQNVIDGAIQINNELSQSIGFSFGDFLAGAAGTEYLRTGQVTLEQVVAGIEMPAEHPFVMVDGNEPSGLMIPVTIPRKPQKLVLLFDMFSSRSITPLDDVAVQFGLVSSDEIIFTENIVPSSYIYITVPDTNGSYLVHTGWQKIILDISNTPSGKVMFGLAVDSSQAPISFGFAPYDVVIIPEPDLLGDFDKNRIVDFADYVILAKYWLERDCNYPDWCEGSDTDFNGSVDFAELRSFVDNWLCKRILVDFDRDGDVDSVDLLEFTHYWLDSESSLDIVPSLGDGRIDFRDFALFADHWLEGTSP